MRDFVLTTADLLQITTPADWYNVTEQQVLAAGQKLPWKDHGELATILSNILGTFRYL